MIFSAVAKLTQRKDADLLILPYWESGRGPKAAALLDGLASYTKPPISSKDFKAKEGEICLLYVEKQQERRLALLGLGKEEKLTVDALRKTYAKVAKLCQEKKLSKINLLLPSIAQLRKVNAKEFVKGVCEGILLANYQWGFKSKEEEKPTLLSEAALIGILPEEAPLLKECEKVAESVYFTRDLVNENADTLNPLYFQEIAKNLSEKFPSIKTTIFDKNRIEKEKMGLLLAVGKGAAFEPALIFSSYRGDPRSKDHTLLVGKGITFDTGGLNLKPTGGIETMREDMAGAATVMGALTAAASLDLKANITAIMPIAENAIDNKSYKPGDVYRSYLGKTVEIISTDAEGRLILADALAYSVKNLKPTRIIDFATLTGSMVVALGYGISGFFSNHDRLSEQLIAAGETAGELLWRLPLFQAYKEDIKSKIADLKNCGPRPAGSITAALFLEEFVGDIPWAHVDIAGTAFLTRDYSYWPQGGVGFGVRLIVEFLKKLTSKSSLK